MNFWIYRKGASLSFIEKLFDGLNNGTIPCPSSAIFVILWAIDNSPHSISAFFFQKNRWNNQQPLILPTVCSTSITLCERSSSPQNKGFHLLVFLIHLISAKTLWSLVSQTCSLVF